MSCYFDNPGFLSEACKTAAWDYPSPPISKGDGTVGFSD